VAGKIITPEQRAQASALRAVLAARRSAGDLIDIGAYQSGANPRVDAALANEETISRFLTQPLDETSAAHESWQRLSRLVTDLGGAS
jgi:flagellum-specific ATP synthase